MSALPLLLLMFAAKQEQRGGGTSPKKQPRWPGPKHHPPKHVPAMPPMPPMPHETEHASPAQDAQAEEQHVDTHKHEPTTHAVHHDTATPVHKAHRDVAPAPHASKHVEQHQRPRARTTTTKPKSKPAFHRVPGTVSVANLQRILVGLGWKGHLTTKGPLSPYLTDGLAPLHWPAQPSVTADDWVQSARKRGLDPSFARVAPKVVRVNPATYSALEHVAQNMGAVVGIRIP